MDLLRRLSVLAVALLSACGGDETEPTESECSAPDILIDGACVPPDNPAACPAGTLTLDDGSCQPAGIPADGCSEGFEHDGDVGCLPILPTERCPSGMIAVPGDTACREVMPCGSGPWGDLPVDANTVYVDQSYVGVDSDGSEAKPWLTIGAAIAAVSSGELIAVAEGRYVEDVVIWGRAVKLWGVCPSKVELVGTSNAVATIMMRTQANGSEIGGLTIGGPSIGILMTGSIDVLVDRVWVRDTGWRGINAQATMGATSMRVVGSLVEGAHGVGVYSSGSEITIEDSVVRSTLGGSEPNSAGVTTEPSCPNPPMCDANARNALTMNRCLLEENYNLGLGVQGSDATVSATVIRNTQPDDTDVASGRGLTAVMECGGTLACVPGSGANITLSGSFLDGNSDIGIQVAGSHALIDNTVIRGTKSSSASGKGGSGMSVQPPCAVSGCDPSHRPSLTLQRSLVEQNQEVGIFLGAADAEIVGVVVRDTLLATTGTFGRGIHVQQSCTSAGCDPTSGSVASINGSLFERNVEVGIAVISATARIDATLVSDTRDRDGILGDGVVVWSHDGAASGTISNSRIEHSVRAGLSNFGASVSLSNTTIACAAFELAGADHESFPLSFTDEGGNACGCPDADGVCKMQSTNIEPPPAL